VSCNVVACGIGVHLELLPGLRRRVDIVFVGCVAWSLLRQCANGRVLLELLRAENRIHGSDQQGCSPGALPVMITDHVPAVGVSPAHATSRVAAAVPA